MKKDNDILARIDRRDGMTVPEGFFEEFASKMAAQLPDNPAAEQPRVYKPMTAWQRVRPFVYMAAMFAGIWCMLKMFTLMTPSAGVDLSVENNPVLTDALSDENFFYEHVVDQIPESETLDEMWEDSITVDDMMGAPDDWSEEEYPATETDEPGAADLSDPTERSI